MEIISLNIPCQIYLLIVEYNKEQNKYDKKNTAQKLENQEFEMKKNQFII